MAISALSGEYQRNWQSFANSCFFFSGIPFVKCESLARLTNLKAIGKGTYFNLREQFLFPVLKSTWEKEQKTVLNELKARESGVVLAA